MKWWISRNGRTEGPYSEEDIRKRITLNMVGSLDRVSIDRQRWQYLKDTELWRPQNKKSAETSPIRLEHSTAMSPLSALRSTPRGSSMPTDNPLVPIPERLQMPKGTPPPSHPNRKLILLVCGGAAAVLAIMLITMTVLLSSRSSMKGVAGNSTAGFEAVREAVALIECKEGSGTGFLLDMGCKTYLMSNEHVVRSGGKIEARLIDGTLLQLGEFSVAADGRDLVRFEVLGCNKKPLRLRENMPSIGEQVTAYGNSLGGGVATESKGFIQGVGPTRIETNAEIVHGNSGGPLVDTHGEVVGVTAHGQFTDSGREDRSNANTRYDGTVRRYAVRLTGVNWKVIDRSEYERQVLELADFKTFWGYLKPYLLLERGDVPEEYLDYNDLCSKDFNIHGTGFDDMLKEVAKKYEKSGKAIARWAEWEKGRKELIRRLDLEIDSQQLTKEGAKKRLSEYVGKMFKAYTKMKEECRGMILIRKEALNHARTFLSERTWSAPQIEKGYVDHQSYNVDLYRSEISSWTDKMNQLMKNLNKTLKEYEEGNDDEND